MRDIGPEMLEALEAKRSTMSDSAYRARRLEIEELIRKGQAVEYSILDRAGRALLVIVGFVLAGLVGVGVGSESPGLGLILAILIAVGAMYAASRWGR